MRPYKFRAWDKTTGMIHFDFDDLYYNTATINHGVYDVPVMQFSGVLDQEGKEIFERDIIICAWGKSSEVGIVEFKDGCFKVTGLKRFLDIPLYLRYPNHKVIGNIYENPELLEVKLHGS